VAAGQSPRPNVQCPMSSDFTPLESTGDGRTDFPAQVADFPRSAKVGFQFWPISHIFPQFLTPSMKSFLHAPTYAKRTEDGFVRFGVCEKARKNGFVRFRPVYAKEDFDLTQRRRGANGIKIMIKSKIGGRIKRAVAPSVMLSAGWVDKPAMDGDFNQKTVWVVTI
jgi:hypothetical protein